MLVDQGERVNEICFRCRLGQRVEFCSLTVRALDALSAFAPSANESETCSIFNRYAPFLAPTTPRRPRRSSSYHAPAHVETVASSRSLSPDRVAELCTGAECGRRQPRSETTYSQYSRRAIDRPCLWPPPYWADASSRCKTR